MKLSFEGVRANALRQLSNLMKVAKTSEDYNEEKCDTWAIECCISAYHDCLLAVMRGDVPVEEIKDFLLAFRTKEEIDALRYCGEVVCFKKSEEA